MKRIVTLLLALAMVLGLAACGGQPGGETTPPATSAPETTAPETTAPETGAPGLELSADGRYPAETVKIGFINYDTTADLVLKIQEYFAYLQQAFNFEVMWSESLDSAEAEFAFIEQCAAAGCKAVIGYYNEGREESVKLASSLGMYYWGQGNDETIQAACGSDPYYLGSYDTGNTEYNFGKAIADTLVANDCHKIIVMSGGKDFGVQHFIDRYAGIMDGIQQAKDSGYDIEMVYEVPGWPGTEEFSAHQTAALETDADGLAGCLTALMWIQPMQNANKFGQIKVAAIETVSEDMVGLMQAGMYVGGCAELPDVFGMAIPMILNAVGGYAQQQRNADGSAPLVPSSHLFITSADDMAFYAQAESADGTWVFSIDDVKSVMGAYNPDFTLEQMGELYTAVSVADIQARRGG